MKYTGRILIAVKACVILSCFLTSKVTAQDIIVFRDSLTEIKCRIININDSVIMYNEWRSESDSVYYIKRFDVLSYTVNKNQYLKRQAEKPIANENLLEKYKSGEFSKGFIITNSGDTVNGTINIRDLAFNQLVLDWIDKNGERISYRPFDIQGYGYDLLYYESMEIDFDGEITAGEKCDGKLFLDKVIDGPARLYNLFRLTYSKSVMTQYEKPPIYYGSLKVDYYVIPPKGESRIIKGNSPRNNLIKLFEDHELLVEDMIKNKPLKSEVPDVVNKYNYWYENIKK